ncbi:hypothetical protein B0H17DRAFT_1061662 [Mycena rosella]|uniref:Uncharacterized protein n=1 Tax=Mycena rosella TaxID=1033263 RepID=A0AAD7GIC1_MYCRO|nr:hypothetical protein B0H17DRAFT_1061662 [Mycena rosella]
MSSSLLAVNLAALTCSSLFYGMFLVLSSTSMYLLVGRYLASRQSRTTPQNRSIFRSTVFIAAICLFASVTAHWITTVYRAFLAFIYFEHGDAAVAFYADTAQATELVQEAFLMISILIGDSLIIHRLWVVWEHRTSIVVFPICTLAALTMCSAVSIYTVSHKAPGMDIFSDPWLTSNCVLTLVTNVYSTVLITYKIWNITRVARPIGGSNLRDFLVIVVESAAIYASWAVFFIATYQTRSLVQFFVIQAAPEVVGVVNALIHTRVGLGWAVEAQAGSPPASEMAFAKARPTPQMTVESGDPDMMESGVDFRANVGSGAVGRGWLGDVEEISRPSSVREVHAAEQKAPEEGSEAETGPEESSEKVRL